MTQSFGPPPNIDIPIWTAGIHSDSTGPSKCVGSVGESINPMDWGRAGTYMLSAIAQLASRYPDTDLVVIHRGGCGRHSGDFSEFETSFTDLALCARDAADGALYLVMKAPKGGYYLDLPAVDLDRRKWKIVPRADLTTFDGSRTEGIDAPGIYDEEIG